jgi:hypothetical protein
MSFRSLVTQFIAGRLKSDVKGIQAYTCIVFKNCQKCDNCVHIFKTMQEDPCWDCVEHNYDAYEKR